MKQYLNLLDLILKEGVKKEDRTGTGTLSIFGHQMRFDLRQGFPVLTTKYIHVKSVIHELLWMLRGYTNISYLKANNVKIWDEWADSKGDLGPVYGKQWRAWKAASGTDIGEIDQFAELVSELRRNPDSRRLIINCWNVGDIPYMALPPCHVMFQFYVCNGELSCQLYQRSADVFLGLPFNITSYALLTHLVAHQCNLKVGEFIWTGGDCHLYSNHIKQAEEQLKRKPFWQPSLMLRNKPKSLFDYVYGDIDICNYMFHPHIKANVSI